ncbi:hypothetical protein FK220_011585 [Flavobacteriaceae bacterium TP-CH-4]|uniref:Thoeris protein ThsB TIR-like domain-containing protein n=1 Tax=Pelagihabitans pacificus TaxID=2696054 RepID=A0A967E603_9FLAO|nr:TIR domain-containing protein [Pelagihabitans pacificus]NHF59987.1 hypothetical protein [Pelagihabitans pacificus]
MQILLKWIIGGLIAKSAYNQLVKEKVPQRRVFISHSWKKGSLDYEKLIKKIKKEKILIYNHSIPTDKAFDERKKKELEKIFRKQMIYCSKVFVLANKGLRSDSYVQTEIRIAKELGKEIIAVKPVGQKGIPYFIRNKADKIIANKINSIKKVLK